MGFKGPGTLIINNKIYVNYFSNSILASAGTGDVLAGQLCTCSQNLKSRNSWSTNILMQQKKY